MSDLVVKFKELEDSQAALKKIMTEFDNSSKRTDADSGIWSNSDLEGAMHSFATNWKDHKEKLLKKMDDAYKHSEKCLESWRKTDSSLASSLTTHQSSGGGRTMKAN